MMSSGELCGKEGSGQKERIRRRPSGRTQGSGDWQSAANLIFSGISWHCYYSFCIGKGDHLIANGIFLLLHLPFHQENERE